VGFSFLAYRAFLASLGGPLSFFVLREKEMNQRAAAITIEKQRVLLVHRIKEEREYWVLPGGSVELGESVEEACHREVMEETGLTVCILRHVLALENAGRREDYFLAHPTGGTLRLGEPERSRRSPTNQYLLEWVDRFVLDQINFQPEELRDTIAEQLAAGDA
jgi:8-oxo-dGTP diphosphatase